MKKIYLANRKGYTLIEMIIVLAIISLLLPMIFSVMYIILRQQLKIYRIVETKREGDRILTFIKEKVIREGYMIRDDDDATGLAQCVTPGFTYSDVNNFIFKKGPNVTDQSFSFYPNSNSIFFTDFTTLNTALNKSSVHVSSFNISCLKRTSAHKALVQISFTVTFNDPSPTNEEGVVSLPYRTKIRLRY